MKISAGTQFEISLAFSARLQQLRECRALIPEEDARSLAFWDALIAKMRTAREEFDRARYSINSETSVTQESVT